jgi:hypothetical protein
MRTLGDEVYLDGNGTQPDDSGVTPGPSWTREHIVDHYQPCWSSVLANGEFDATICDSGVGRWTNYYVEGLRHSVAGPVQIDGVYYDGIAFTRDTMQRVRWNLDNHRVSDQKLVDLHCGNLYTGPWKASNANAYSHLMPYVDSLWFGEGFDYSLPYDYWFTAIAGIPFGLFGEMLGEGNPYYGMVFGITARYLYGSVDPSPIWEFWDYWGINSSQMIGWWDPNCPVVADIDNVIITVYQQDSSSLLAIANWNSFNVDTQLNIDWTALGLDPKNSVLWAKEISNFQNSQTFSPFETIPIEATEGWLLIVKKNGT